jgi:fructose-1,6-bisphosphatase/inositol monophosphatase family enzyme
VQRGPFRVRFPAAASSSEKTVGFSSAQCYHAMKCRSEKRLKSRAEPPNAPAALALRHQAAGVRADTKPDASPVTQADRECEKLIAGILEQHFPTTECSARKASRKESRNGRRWIVDPIDGTRDFVRRNPLWSVLIALEQDNAVQAGVVHLPVLGNTCWASRGGGAFRNDTPMRVSKITDPSAAVLSVNSLNRISEMPFSRGLIEWASRFWAYRCLAARPTR